MTICYEAGELFDFTKIENLFHNIYWTKLVIGDFEKQKLGKGDK